MTDHERGFRGLKSAACFLPNVLTRVLKPKLLDRFENPNVEECRRSMVQNDETFWSQLLLG